MSAGEATASGWGTDRGGCVEAIKTNTLLRHSIEVRGFYNGVTVVGDIPPALVIGHDQNNIRLFVSWESCSRNCQNRQAEEFGFDHVRKWRYSPRSSLSLGSMVAAQIL
jgi:hypothetical protein